MTDTKWAEDQAKKVCDSWSFDPRKSAPLQTLISNALLEAERRGINIGIEKAAKYCEGYRLGIVGNEINFGKQVADGIIKLKGDLA